MTLQKMTCLMVGASFLTACATTSPITHDNPTPSAMSAKDSLASAVKSQLYHSFGYQTDVYVSNHAHRDELANTPQDDGVPTENDCNKTHDDAYVALLKKAHDEQGGKKLDEYLKKNYSQEQQAIKSAYQTCMTAVIGDKDGYEPFDFDAFYQQYHALNADEKAQAFLVDTATHVVAQMAIDEVENDENSTDHALNAKKAELLNAYLLQSGRVSVMGSYHPLKGYMTALPSVQYNAKNLHFSVNQPIHIDIKAGGIYLWADNFALANSQFLDKNLGDKWQNKWLFLPLNDGSLPDDFIKDLTQAYLTAKKESFLVTPNESFDWVSADSLKGVPFLADNLPQATFATMTATPRIIKNELSAKDKAYRDYVFAEVLYNTIIKKYPDLALEQLLGYDLQTMERDIVDGESVVTVRNADKPQNDESATPQEPKINARFFAVMFLSNLNQQVQSYYHSLDEQNATQDDVDNDAGTPSLVYYGIDGGRVSWVSQRYYLKNQGRLTKKLSDVPMMVDVFTKIHQDASQTKAFARLPSHLQTPNASNSINLLDYKDEFLKNIQSGNDKYLQTLMGLVFGTDVLDGDVEEMEFDEP